MVDVQPGVRDVRDTNLCRIHAVSLAPRRVAVFAAIDNLWKGASGQAIQNLNLMLGSTRRRGCGERAAGLLPVTLGVRADGVAESEPEQLAPGFRAGAAACGLKAGGETDVGAARLRSGDGPTPRCC